MCSAILKTTWHYVCVHNIWNGCSKMKQLLHVELAYKKNSLFHETWGQHIMHDTNDSKKTVREWQVMR